MSSCLTSWRTDAAFQSEMRLQGYNNKLPQLHSCESPQLHEKFFLQNSGAKILHLAHIHNDNFEKNSDKKGRIKKNP